MDLDILRFLIFLLVGPLILLIRSKAFMSYVRTPKANRTRIINVLISLLVFIVFGSLIFGLLVAIGFFDEITKSTSFSIGMLVAGMIVLISLTLFLISYSRERLKRVLMENIPQRTRLVAKIVSFSLLFIITIFALFVLSLFLVGPLLFYGRIIEVIIGIVLLLIFTLSFMIVVFPSDIYNLYKISMRKEWLVSKGIFPMHTGLPPESRMMFVISLRVVGTLGIILVLLTLFSVFYK